jgi:hypothetical protein
LFLWFNINHIRYAQIFCDKVFKLYLIPLIKLTELYIFKTAQNPDFLVGVRKSQSPEEFEEERKRFQEKGRQFMDKLKIHNPNAGYPYFALMYDEILHNDTLCFIRPDSEGLGGLKGGLKYWPKFFSPTEEFDGCASEGLARIIHAEFSKPMSTYKHLNPITCVVDFIGNLQIFNSAYELLKSRYDVRIVNV